MTNINSQEALSDEASERLAPKEAAPIRSGVGIQERANVREAPFRCGWLSAFAHGDPVRGRSSVAT